MQRLPMHMLGWMHSHKLEWHTMGVHFGHLLHDPRFWAGVALAILLGLMILTAIFSKSTQGTPMVPTYPVYPYVP